ncbi:hypothetical protein SCHPADRAFT_938491 [Schizopora paradoxa]|uniref:DUF6697 domain-containing protein n=1 Tax=Schizopora paradoxa TaxID=27342 RepID=A0A0H2RUE5_9AGAM|nr:hypothetical protein SCHPADRAFT_938491 [Schizopora paradoxa]
MSTGLEEVENTNALPFGFVKKEFELVDLTGLTAEDGMILETSGTLTVVPTEDVPNAIVEVAIPAHLGSLDAYRSVSNISTPEILDVDAMDDGRLGELVQPDKMKNENAKIKKETFRLAESTITKYIKLFDLRSTQVPQDGDSQQNMDRTVRREFLSRLYGGSMQELFSKPSADRVTAHGHRQFVCPMISIHPWAPQLPGQPGLVFDCPPKSYDEPWIGDGSFPCIAGLQPGKWLYVGNFKWRGHGWLTREEWKSLPTSVKRDWVSYVMEKKWGVPLRMSIRLRRTLRKEPTRRQVKKASDAFEKGGRLDDVTSQEVIEAFDKGKEVTY